MKTGQKGRELIKKFEGCKLTAYQCPAGVWTIGVGHTGNVKKGQTITQEQAEEIFTIDLEVIEKAILSFIKVPLNNNQFDALVSFAFNVGPSALKSSTLLKKLNAKDYEGAADQFLRWVYAGKVKLRGLVRRREAERALFLTAVS